MFKLALGRPKAEGGVAGATVVVGRGKTWVYRGPTRRLAGFELRRRRPRAMLRAQNDWDQRQFLVPRPAFEKLGRRHNFRCSIVVHLGQGKFPTFRIKFAPWPILIQVPLPVPLRVLHCPTGMERSHYWGNLLLNYNRLINTVCAYLISYEVWRRRTFHCHERLASSICERLDDRRLCVHRFRMCSHSHLPPTRLRNIFLGFYLLQGCSARCLQVQLRTLLVAV